LAKGSGTIPNGECSGSGKCKGQGPLNVPNNRGRGQKLKSFQTPESKQGKWQNEKRQEHDMEGEKGVNGDRPKNLPRKYEKRGGKTSMTKELGHRR